MKKLIVLSLSLIIFYGCSTNEGVNEPGPAVQKESATDPKLLTTGAVVVDFYADWCIPCKQFKPEFDAVQQKLSDKVTFLRINIDHDRANAEKFSIISIPTVAILKDGEEIDRIIGAVPAKELESKVRAAFNLKK